MFIDPHVHCRDFEEKNKETIAHALRVAEQAGFSAIFDMAANGNPAVTGEEHVLARTQRAREADSAVWYGLYMLMTKNRDQRRRAVDTFGKYLQVVGFKLFAGHSVRNLGITPMDDQFEIYRDLANAGYKGVLVTHCEKDEFIHKLINGDQNWDPKYPITHAFARPPEAEVESVRDQIMLARNSGFGGTLHIAHISVPEAVELVDDARKYMKITCGVTPHHVLFDAGRMEEDDGVLYKMNPPLRPRKMKEGMFQYLKEGKIDWIETDHAPHEYDKKAGPPYLSGIPWLHCYPFFIDTLRHNNFSEQQIEDLTFNNIDKAFSRPGRTIPKRKVEPSYLLRNEYPIAPL